VAAPFAARLATLPTTSRVHGRTPPLRPDRDSASRVVDAATIIPSTDNGVSAATHPGWLQLNQEVHVQVGNGSGDQRQQCHASDRRPPDPPIRPPAHRAAPSTSSPVIAGMYVRAVFPSHRHSHHGCKRGSWPGQTRCSPVKAAVSMPAPSMGANSAQRAPDPPICAATCDSRCQLGAAQNRLICTRRTAGRRSLMQLS
jgi:hypothetical protein